MAQTDPQGRTTRVERDARARESARMYPPTVAGGSGARTSRTYDALGGEFSRVAPSGVVTAMTYDAAHRLAQRTQPEGVVTFGYMPTGLRQVVQDARGATGQVSGTTFTETYTYDAERRRSSLTAGDLRFVADFVTGFAASACNADLCLPEAR